MKIMSTTAKPFCKAPWVNLHYHGTLGIAPCCEWRGDYFYGNIDAFNSSKTLEDIKKRMYDGNVSKTCSECIGVEESGVRSSRQSYEEYDMSTGVQLLDYRPSNSCNLMCRMCNAESSSLIAKEQNIIVNVLDTEDVNKLELDKLVRIKILGGEPSVDVKCREFLDKLSKINSDVEIDVTTNATNVSKKWFDLLKKFDNIYLQLSVDGAGVTQDYIRTLSKWEEISNNLDIYEREFGDRMSLHMTAQMYNYAIIDSWFDYFIDSDIELEQYLLDNPLGFSLRALKPKYREIVCEWLDKKNDTKCNQAIAIINTHEYDEMVFREFKKTTRYYDKLRNTNIEDIHPRFKDIMKDSK